MVFILEVCLLFNKPESPFKSHYSYKLRNYFPLIYIILSIFDSLNRFQDCIAELCMKEMLQLVNLNKLFIEFSRELNRMIGFTNSTLKIISTAFYSKWICKWKKRKSKRTSKIIVWTDVPIEKCLTWCLCICHWYADAWVNFNNEF